MDFTVFKCMLHTYKWMQETKAFSNKPFLVEMVTEWMIVISMQHGSR